MLAMLIAWDADGNVVATQNVANIYDDTPERAPLGTVDVETHEVAGGSLSEVWVQSNAVGSGTWPEWLGGRVYDYKVELRPGPKGGSSRIKALVHKETGERRERAEIERLIEARIEAAKSNVAPGEDLQPVADLRDLLGGPQRPLELDEKGRTRPRTVRVRPKLPLLDATRKAPKG